MVILKRIFLLMLLLLGTWQLRAQYVLITSPAAAVTGPQCSVHINPATGEYDSPTQTFNLQLAGSGWGPAPGTNVTYELVNVYNTSQVYATTTSPTFSPNTAGGTATVTFKLPKLAYNNCFDTIWAQVRVTYSGASPSSIYSSFARGFSFSYTPPAVFNSSPPYQVLDTLYREHCPGAFPQVLQAAYNNVPFTLLYQWQQISGSAWTNISGATSVLYNAMANGTYRCIVRSPVCGLCEMPTSPYVVRDIASLQISSSIPPGTSPQQYTPGMILQRSAPGPAHTYTGYQWYRNGVPVAGATNNAYAPTSKGTYTLSGSGPCGWQMSNSFVLTDDCHPAGYKMISGTNLTGSFTGKFLMSGEYTVPSGAVATFNAADVIMQPCTRITVVGGGTLNIRASLLRSCIQWYGIVVAKGGTLIVDTSTISDAYIAVTGSEDNARFDIQRSVFRDNHLSVWSRKNTVAGMQSIHDNNLFTDIDLTNGIACDNIKPVATTIDPLHDYVFLDGSNHVNIIKNNTFKGFPVPTSPDLYSCPVIAVQANVSASMFIATGNKFTDMLLDGVLMNDCAKMQITDNNQFSALTRYGNAVNVIGGYDISIDNANVVKNYAYGVKAAGGGSHISVTGNSFTDNLYGISFDKLNSYEVDGNIISSVFTGMETYNDSHPAITPPPFKISNNIFQGLYQGLIISPVKNPLYSATTGGNKLLAGPQNVQVLCNNFAGNSIAITGSAPIIDQYYSGQQWASNIFQSSLWDIAWVDSPAVVDMNYYYDASLVPPSAYIPNVTPSMPPLTMNGVTVNTSFVSVIGTGNGAGNCNYDPYTNAAARYAGVGTVTGNNSLVTVYPNPASGWLNIDMAGGGAFDYTVYNLTGQAIQAGQSNAPAKIDLAGMAPGIYLLKLVMADGHINNYRFVKE